MINQTAVAGGSAWAWQAHSYEAKLARLALAHEACDNFPPPGALPEARQARYRATQQHETQSLRAGNLARQRAMLAQKDHMASIGGTL